MKVVFYILVAWVGLAVTVTIVMTIGWVLWWLVAPKSWYLYNAAKWRGRKGPKFILWLYGRYGSDKATELLVKYLLKKARRIHTPKIAGIEKERFEKARNDFETFMWNSIRAVRSMGMAEKVFPQLEAVVAALLFLEPRKLKTTRHTYVDGLLIDSSSDIAPNPILKTARWLLQELKAGNAGASGTKTGVNGNH